MQITFDPTNVADMKVVRLLLEATAEKKPACSTAGVEVSTTALADMPATSALTGGANSETVVVDVPNAAAPSAPAKRARSPKPPKVVEAPPVAEDQHPHLSSQPQVAADAAPNLFVAFNNQMRELGIKMTDVFQACRDLGLPVGSGLVSADEATFDMIRAQLGIE